MRSQLGLLRRGRLMSNGQGGGETPPPGGQFPPPILPPGANPPPTPPAVAFEVSARESGNGAIMHWVLNIPTAWANETIAGTAVAGIFASMEVEYRVGGVIVPDAFTTAQVSALATFPRSMATPTASGFVPGGEFRSTLLLVQSSGPALRVYWGRSDWASYDALTPVMADNDPDDAEALVAVLDELVTHATFDAWVQDHEAFLPERPDNWTTMNLASKRAWVVANYDFNAVEPDAEGVAHDTAGAEDGADETGADEGTGNAADEADNTDD